MNTKTCTKCQIEKEFKFFSKDKTHADGYRSNCKSCISSYMKEYFVENREEITDKRHQRYIENREEELTKGKVRRTRNGHIWNENRKRKHEKDPLSNIVSCASRRAKKKGMEFDLKKEDLSIPEFCPVLGIKLYTSRGRPTANSPTIDRIDNSRGYTKDNVIIVSYKANTIKNNSTLKELEKIYIFYNNLIKERSENGNLL